MKFKTLLAIALCAAIPAMACAKKPKKQKEPVEPAFIDPYQIPKDECEDYFSLEHESLRNKDYQTAYEQWMPVFTTCPDIQRQLYTDGARILEALYKEAKAQNNEQEMIRIANLIMKMYDKRMQYFGDDERYPISYILSTKAVDYKTYFEGTEAYSRDTVYVWLHEAMKHDQASPFLAALEMLFNMSFENYQADKTNQEKADLFVEDYNNVLVGLAILVDDTTYANRELAGQKKDWFDQQFAQSGVADCSKLDELYAGAVKEHANDYSVLRRLAALYRQMDCEESPVYAEAIKQMKILRPAEQVASGSAGQAKLCLKKKDYQGAITNFKKALTETNSASDKADYLYLIAQCYYASKSYQTAADFAKQSLGVKPGQGRCYMLIGNCYATAKPYSGNSAREKILNKTVFWAACDMFEKAKADPSTAAKAASAIATYSKYFPTKEERFDLPKDFKGTTFFVGGWVNVTTRIR
ncbi:MAG: tetratricopeptide repeat protein [Paludibacteraceae bacterium]|nr:tetratricopeptide repeat protein [Paludibacteraceae bacterium]